MPLWARTLLLTVPAAEAAEAAEGHREQLRALARQGRLRSAGELGPGDGFLEIFEARDRREAEEISRSSPIVEDGLGAVLLREWRELDLGS
jgi:uncharacterized protein YciI